MDPAGMSAIITGAAQGMGQCFAEELAARRVNVAVCDINGEALERAAQEAARRADVRVLARTVDLKAYFLFSRSVLPGMRKRRFGRIINMASEAGKNGGTLMD